VIIKKLDFLESSAFHENSISITLQTEMVLFAGGTVTHQCTEVASSSPSVTKLLRQLDRAFKKLASLVTKLLQVRPRFFFDSDAIFLISKIGKINCIAFFRI